MKIKEIRTHLLQKNLTSSMKISRGGFEIRRHIIVEVITDEGITGLGEGVGDALLIQQILSGSMSQQAIGLDPMNIEVIRSKLIDSGVYMEQKGSVICAASAIEMACWDIKGKVLNVPVFQLLGGLYKDKIEAYASDIYWEEDAKKMGENASRVRGYGYRTIKAHLGCKSPKEETCRVHALREAIGPDINLMIDLNGGYNKLQAMEAAKLWEPFNLYWLEEPVGACEIESLANLQNKISIPIAAGENEFRVHGFKNLFDKNAVSIAMPDIGRVGGIQEARNICTLAQSYGILVSPHNYSSGILLAATIQLMASVPNTQLLEIDTSDNAIYQELLVEPLEIENGFVKVPQFPGLGVKLDQKILEKYSVN
jgi:L-alanine-DL-glutamate epimerase-like enolase superfamily enzyme